jgi:dihydropteroate synthase
MAARPCPLRALAEDGADILDIGGESTRPARRHCRWMRNWRVCCRWCATPSRWACRCRWIPTSPRSCRPCWTWVPTSSTTSGRCGREPGARRGRVVVARHPLRRVPDAHAPRPQTMQQATHGRGCGAPGAIFFGAAARTILRRWGGQDSHRAGPRHRLWQDGGAELFAAGAPGASCWPLGYPLLAGWSRKSSLAAVTQRSLAAWPPWTAATAGAQRGGGVLAVERGATSCGCMMCARRCRRWVWAAILREQAAQHAHRLS